MTVRCVLTRAGEQFVTPLTLAALSENQVYTGLFDLKDEVEMGHIQLSREADLVVVAPATADLLAKMAGGIADDLATTLLLARSEEHTSELQSLMRISYAVFCLKKKNIQNKIQQSNKRHDMQAQDNNTRRYTKT